MNSTLLLGIIAAITIAIAGSGLGLEFVSAQMADNATMGNMTDGNMTMLGEMNQTGSISGIERIE